MRVIWIVRTHNQGLTARVLLIVSMDVIHRISQQFKVRELFLEEKFFDFHIN